MEIYSLFVVIVITAMLLVLSITKKINLKATKSKTKNSLLKSKNKHFLKTNLLNVLKKTKSKHFYTKTKNNNYILKNSLYTNCFYQGFSTLITTNKKTLNLPNKFVCTEFFKGLIINKKTIFKNENCVLTCVTVKNVTNKTLQLNVANKNHFFVTTPTLYLNNKNQMVHCNYENNSVVVLFYNQNKKLKQQYQVNSNADSSLHKVNLTLLPKQEKTVKILLYLQLQKSTMQNSKFTYVTPKVNAKTQKDFVFSYHIKTNNENLNELLNITLPKLITKHFKKATATICTTMFLKPTLPTYNFFLTKPRWTGC